MIKSRNGNPFLSFIEFVNTRYFAKTSVKLIYVVTNYLILIDFTKKNLSSKIPPVVFHKPATMSLEKFREINRFVFWFHEILWNKIPIFPQWIRNIVLVLKQQKLGATLSADVNETLTPFASVYLFFFLTKSFSPL